MAAERELFLAGQFASDRFRGSMRESFGEFSPLRKGRGKHRQVAGVVHIADFSVCSRGTGRTGCGLGRRPAASCHTHRDGAQTRSRGRLRYVVLAFFHCGLGECYARISMHGNRFFRIRDGRVLFPQRGDRMGKAEGLMLKAEVVNDE
jgi:hypothetical protein